MNVAPNAAKKGTHPEAINAMPTQLTDITAQPQAANAAGLTPAAAWSRRVRRIGGLIQAAFWAQNLILPPLWALAKAFGVRPYYHRWDSRIPDAGSGRPRLPGN